MILWCAYCQTCLGEKAPFDSFALSHGICDSCAANGVALDDDAVDAILPIADLYRQIEASMRKGDMPTAKALVASGLKVGLKPIDLSWGVLQPLLYRIGDLWAAGKLSVALEHQASAQVQAALDLLFDRDPALSAHRQSASPFILLAEVEGNYHSIGLKVVELALAAHGIASAVFLPGLPSSEILAQVKALRPAVLGLSVSDQGQMEPVRGIRDELVGLPRALRPRLLLGGSLFRLPFPSPAGEGFDIAPDIHALIPALVEEQRTWFERLRSR